MSRGGFGDVRRLGTVTSTNSYLLKEARRGAPEGLVAVAEHQTAGRGRLGRRWEAPPGACLLVSVLFRPILDPARLHLCTAAVALSAAEACRSMAGIWPTVKWPNDLLVGEGKLAGVLAEVDPDAPGGPEGSVAVVVGIGVNIDYPGPEGAGGTSLREETGRGVDRLLLLDALLGELDPRSAALHSAAGQESLAAELRGRCRTLGQAVRVELSEGTIVGIAVDLTVDGHLVIETGTGRREVAAGDVVHLRSAEGQA